MIQQPIYINNLNFTCVFCKSLYGVKKLITSNTGWIYCDNCKQDCINSYDRYMKSTSIITFDKFTELTNDLNIPKFYTIKRTNNELDTNWYFSSNTENIFMYWNLGVWIILICKYINCNLYTKYINFTNLNDYNEIDTSKIINIIDNFVSF